MKNKFFALMTMTLVTMALALAASAQSNKRPDPGTKPQVNPEVIKRGVPQKVMLTCTPGGSKDVSTPLYVKNPTANDIAANTLVYYTANGGSTSKQQLTQVLKKNNGNEVSLLGPAGGVSACQAWIMK